MNQPSVSIIVPVYNVEPYVENCIRSVMRQTYDGPIECIVVDDCGTDNSMPVIKRMIAEYNGPIAFKILHHEHNRGLSAARNTGIDAAAGDYLFFLDSDDELSDDCIERLTEPLKTEWYDVIVGNLAIVGSDKPYSGLILDLPNHTVLRDKDILNTYRIKWNMMAQSKLYKALFIRDFRLSFMEGLIHEDEVWSFQVACLAKSLYAVNHVTYYYLIRQDGISVLSKGGEKVKNISIIVKELGLFIKEQKIFNLRVHQIIQGFFFNVLKYYSKDIVQFKEKYWLLRPFIKPSFKNLCHIHRFHTKWYIRDFHYYVPDCLAPYWLFLYIKHRIR